jgi:uncharacterized membrane protein HdeD (DUF308 family)
VLFGLAALFLPGLVLEVLLLLFGAYALVDGILAVVAAFRSSGRDMRRPLLLIEGVIGILFGIVTLFWPGLTALALLYVVAFWAIFSGIARIVMAITLRREIENEWSIGLSGALSAILGIALILLPGAGCSRTPGSSAYSLWHLGLRLSSTLSEYEVADKREQHCGLRCFFRPLDELPRRPLLAASTPGVLARGYIESPKRRSYAHISGGICSPPGFQTGDE